MHNKEDIDRALSILKREIKGEERNATSCDDVLQYLYDNSHQIWWMAWSVINQTNSNGVTLSHRAPARLTDLADEGLVIKEPVGRFMAYRLNYEQKDRIEARLKIKDAEWKEAHVPKSTVKIVVKDGVPTAVVTYS